MYKYYNGVSQTDLALLSRLIEAETDGDWCEMTTLAAEVVSCVKSGMFDTIAGVVFEYGTYESAEDGSLYAIKPSALSKQAAYDALAGLLY